MGVDGKICSIMLYSAIKKVRGSIPDIPTRNSGVINLISEGLQERSRISSGLWVYLSTLRWSVLSHPAACRRSEEEAEDREKKQKDKMPRSFYLK